MMTQRRGWWPVARPMMRGRVGARGRGFTLIEAVAVVVVLALVVPPSLMWMDDAAARRADAVATMRATTLATAVAETVLADSVAQTPGLGFSAFANPVTYLDTPVSGLRARLGTVASMYESMGMVYAVEVGALVDGTGTVNVDVASNIFRVVTVRVTYPSAEGPSLQVTVPFMVASP